MDPPDVLTARAGRALSEPEERDLEGVGVLLVDDDERTLHAATRVLERLGCRVHATASARDALSLVVGSAPVDVVVTDIIMPEMSGFALADQISKMRPGVRVLLVSGYPKAEVYWGGTPCVRSAFLVKPLCSPELRDTLVSLLGPEGVAGTEGAGLPRSEGPDGAPLRCETREGGRGARLVPSLAGRILIVDDDEEVVRSLQRLFVRAGYAEPLGLTDPRQVADTFTRERVDLMILDLSMPEMDGFQVLATVRTLSGPEEYFPVLMLTGSYDPDTRRRALNAGAMDFLNKPCDPAEAAARVRNLLTARFLNQRLAMHRDALEEEVSVRTAEIADTRTEILYRLARAAEYRDDVTGRHAERVGLLASALATELGLPLAEADLIRRTAPLHDVGKIGVPDAILLKPGPLTPDETAIMQSHTTIGAEILGGSTHRILEVARGIALGHHERWDGAGYPERRIGLDIPLVARIVAVADTFDTITHSRPYKHALSPAVAIQEIVRCRGSQFDPGIVDALRSIRDRLGLDGIQDLLSPLDAARTHNSPDPARSSGSHG